MLLEPEPIYLSAVLALALRLACVYSVNPCPCAEVRSGRAPPLLINHLVVLVALLSPLFPPLPHRFIAPLTPLNLKDPILPHSDPPPSSFIHSHLPT